MILALLKPDPNNPEVAKAHFEAYRQRLIAAIVRGMRQAMSDLSYAAVEQMTSDGVVSRSGRLAGTILGSVRVSHSATEVKGSIAAANKQDPVGLWIERGTHEPAIAGKLMVFFAPNGDLVVTRRHRAFNTPARPFMDQALAARRNAIIATIQTAVAQVEP